MYEGEACREQPVIYIEILLIYLFYLKKKSYIRKWPHVNICWCLKLTFGFYFIYFISFHFEQVILSASGDEKLKQITKLAGQAAKLS